MPPTATAPPRRLCVLRLSALGDVCHVLPVVRTLQDAWPGVGITWIIGRLEHKLLGHLPDVEFVVFDKKAGAAAYRELRARLAGRRFDALLHMQLAIRASLAAAQVPARRRIGFDRARARELQWLFTNERIAPRSREHVLDSLFGFAEALGVPGRSMRWDIPLPGSALDYARRAIPDGAPTLVVEPVLEPRAAQLDARGLRGRGGPRGGAARLAGAGLRRPESARVRIRNAHRRAHAQPLREPRRQGHAAAAARDPRPRHGASLTPDSGPAHMATAVGTPVIGLYAATNPARSGPYHSREWCVDRYDAAARRFRGRPAAELPWTTKIEEPGVMDLITVADVIERLDALLAAGAPRTPGTTGG